MSEKLKEMRFTIKTGEYEDVIFRFFPRDSHCHGFGDKPPKNWKGVYKVYYAWDIVQFGKWRGEIINCEQKSLFDMPWDECSVLTDLGNHILAIIDKEYSESHLNGMGMPTSKWDIEIDGPIVTFTVWNDPDMNGYRFRLYKEKAREFAEFINTINEHMLENGEPI